jgi:hypothetical protein
MLDSGGEYKAQHSRRAIMAKTKVPKKVAGVKVPKGLRNSDLVEAILQSDAARTILANMLIAAAGAAAAVLTQKVTPTAEQMAHAGEAVLDSSSKAASASADVAGSVVNTIGHVVAGAASSLLSKKPGPEEEKKRRKSRVGEAKA